MNLLLTAFGGFDNKNDNVSLKVLEKIENKNIKKLILPVSYNEVSKVLEQEVKENKYDFILNLGQAGGRKEVTLERFALNYQQATIPDNDGNLVKHHRISENLPIAYETSLNIEKIVEDLKDYPVEVSLHAGTFVCNTTYFHSLRLMKGKALFIHLPFYTGQELSDKYPNLALDLMVQIIEKILEAILVN